jgi:two-component sensor histidine kinase
MPGGVFVELALIILPANSRAPQAARQLLADSLPELTTPAVLHDAQLLVSELVTNSVRHGGLGEDDDVVVRVAVSAGLLRLEVENPHTVGVVVRREPNGTANGGYGLELVRLLSTRWGVSRESTTSVWFEMSRAG